MKKKLFIFGGICLLTVLLSAQAQAVPIEDTFSATINGQGNVTGGGTGYNDGYWYEYPTPALSWWNQWFYDHPPDRERWKIIDMELHLTSLSPDSWIDIAVNYTTLDYENPDSPPLPGGNSEAYIVREEVVNLQIPIECTIDITPRTIEILDYNPEWVSVDIRGQDIMIEGTIWHECVPEPCTMGLLALGGLLIRRRKR